MTPERWQRIDELFHAALELPRAERPGFILEKSGGDESLAKQVELMIAADERDGDLLETKPDSVEEPIDPLIGRTISHYTVLKRIAKSGMAIVYLARDTSLHRVIALKLLPDEQHVLRFKQEARFGSAADHHPNVCVIHEIGETEDGRHFIAMEYVDGITLRKCIREKPMTPSEVLDVGIQVAKALKAAHDKGIVHRDIKPENIMLRREDGLVKVLDFGIAKFIKDTLRFPAVAGETIFAGVHTEQGVVVGTPRYMSPEQVKLPEGEPPVDGRSDIWSLGIVLYEMLTRDTPFDAATREEIFRRILDKKPALLTFSADVPAELERIIKKALRKDRNDRYQSVGDLAADLRRLRAQMDRKHRPVIVIITILLLALSIILLFSNDPTPSDSSIATHSTRPFHKLEITPLINSGKSVCAAISPDGKSFAYVERKEGMQELLVTELDTKKIISQVPPSEVNYRDVTFSQDGQHLYFTRIEKSDVSVLYKMALYGGTPATPNPVTRRVDSPISFSPKGDQFAFVRLDRPTGVYSLIVANIDGKNERGITTRRGGDRLSLDGPAWSPDGATIVYGAGYWDKSRGYSMRLIEIRLENESETTIGDHQWYSIYQIAWTEDKSKLVIAARERPLSVSQLWRIPYPRGEPEKITNDTSEYRSVSVTSDESRILSLQSQRHYKLWITLGWDVQLAKEIDSGVGLTFGLNWTADGKIVHSAMDGNNLNLSLIGGDGSKQKLLTNNASDNYTPVVSPDGRFIVFASNHNGLLNIWRINTDGSDLKQLTFTDGNSYPSFSPDGKWVFYDNQTNATPSVWKVPIEGGSPVLIAESARMPVVSPDGQFIACRYYSSPGSRDIAIIPTSTTTQEKRSIRILSIPVIDYQRVQWLSNGRALAYIHTVNGVSNIWRYDLDSNLPKQITNFKSDQIFAYAWSSKHNQLVCERGTDVRSVISINTQN